MMIFFDYLFFRIYSAHAKEEQIPFVQGVSYVTICFFFLFFYVYAHSWFLLTGTRCQRWCYVLLIVILYTLLSFYYKKRKKKILKRFKDSKLNKYIPYVFIIFSFLPFIYIGTVLGVTFESLTK